MNKKTALALIIIFSILSSIFLINSYGKRMNKIVEKRISIESEKIINNLVTTAINEILATKIPDNLFNIKKNKRDEIELLDYNTKEVNNLLKEINKKVQSKLASLEEGKIEDQKIMPLYYNRKIVKKNKPGVIYEVPLGISKKNSLLSNYGPMIPLKMQFVGSVSSSIKTKITPYGFNSLVVEIVIQTEIKEAITLPLTTTLKTINITSPLTIKIIQGLIPEYYYKNGLEKGSFENNTSLITD